LPRSFFLFDTYRGIPLEQASADELASCKHSNETLYPECYETALKNFASVPNAHLIRGVIPESLSTVEIGQAAYLRIDLNIGYPEVGGLGFFWDKMTSGAFILLDDYGRKRCQNQKTQIDKFLNPIGARALELPTGQGLVQRP